MGIEPLLWHISLLLDFPTRFQEWIVDRSRGQLVYFVEGWVDHTASLDNSNPSSSSLWHRRYTNSAILAPSYLCNTSALILIMVLSCWRLCLIDNLCTSAYKISIDYISQVEFQEEHKLNVKVHSRSMYEISP